MDYSDLPTEDSWIGYLRTRLPYSFREVNSRPCVEHGKRFTCYVLSGPMLSTGFAEYHNYWMRGYVYYAVGKLVDFYKLSEFWKEYHNTHTDLLRSQIAGVVNSRMKFPADVYNAIQLEKLWKIVEKDHLDRERTVMTNLTQAIEFCLKAIMTHAEFRETGTFKFKEGHNLFSVFESLPQNLKIELQSESIIFAENYKNYRMEIEKSVSQIDRDSRSLKPNQRMDVATWKNIADVVSQTAYTAFIGVNDPASVTNTGYEPKKWFVRALRDIGDITYHRYSPFQNRDTYPVEPIHLGLMLGRFMYEHLFPVTVDKE